MNLSIQQQFASAINTGNVDQVRSTLSEGADPNLGPLGEHTFYPLLRVCERTHYYTEVGLGRLRILAMMMSHGADPFHLPKSHQGGVLGFYAKNRKEDDDRAVDIILKNWNSSRSWKGILMENGNTLLHDALDNPLLVSVLLRHGMPVDVQNDDGNTSLMYASGPYNKPPEVVRMLLLAGADPYITNRRGETVMWSAIGSINTETNIHAVEALFESGYDHQNEPNLRKIKNRLTRTLADRKAYNLVDQVQALTILKKQFLRENLMARACKVRPDLATNTRSSKPKM